MVNFGWVICGVPPKESIEEGILAEKSGFDFVFIPDHLVDLDGCYVDCWTIMTAIGLQTKKITVSAGVTDIQKVHPAKAAHMIATLNILTGGRAALGIGAGEIMNILPYGLPWETAELRTQRLREYIQVVKKLLEASKNKKVTYQGSFYSLKDAWLDICPLKTKPPIVIGALGKRTIEVAGEFADYWLSWLESPESFAEKRGFLYDIAKKFRPSEKVKAICWLYGAVTEDQEIIIKARRTCKALFVVERNILRKYYGFKVPYEVSAQGALVSDEVMKKIVELSNQVPDELIDKSVAVGNTEKCINVIENFIKSGADVIAFRDLTPNHKNAIKLFKEKIIPYFSSEK